MKVMLRESGLCALLGMLAACGGPNSSGSASTSGSSTTGPAATGSSTGAPLVALTSATYTATPSSSALVAIYRSGSASGAATVAYTTINGTAKAGTDYVGTSGTVTWSNGDSAVKTVAVPVMRQASGKQFSVALTSVQGQAGFGSPTSATVAVSGAAGGASSSSGSSGSAGTTASANGTMIPSASQIVDSANNVWTVVSGVVDENGTTAGYSSNVALLLYYGGTVYQENKSCLWWSWNGSAWISATNPAPSTTPACGSSVAAVPSVSTGFGIKASGSQLVSTLDGSTIHLVGSAVSGLEGSAGNSQRVWEGFPATTVATWQTIKTTWNINVIRLPMNSADWLNLVCHDAGSGNAGKLYHANGDGTYTPDPNHVYQGYVEQTVANITAAGMYVLLDLHWDAPNNAAGQPLCPVGEPS
ncbi:MAG: Calx-beta domain-containing protein, partial [Steroidobacterales bacterium]